ncbi:MAG TPA: hypothetical protein VM261_16895 [Kofleriaceae bacterium]|nr:hypothetical protein [Kofleriaceae bacterium]
MVTVTTLLTVAWLAAITPARAHVQASVDENNRYLKLTPMGDRVRLAYTIFVGERPGATLRKRLDRDRDGQLDDAEASAYGKEIAALVHPAVSVTLDGKPAKIAWTTLDVGLGTPSVAAGSFSVDLVGWVCATGDSHRMVLVDTVELEKPGETEVRLEDGPGVHFGVRSIGGTAFDALDTKWTGAGGPLTLGLDVAYAVDGAAPRPADGRCSGAAAGSESSNAPRYWLWGVAFAVVALVAAAGRALLGKNQRKVNG